MSDDSDADQSLEKYAQREKEERERERMEKAKWKNPDFRKNKEEEWVKITTVCRGIKKRNCVFISC